MASPDRKDLFPGALEMMVLRALSQEPRHGYALVQHIKRTSNDLLQVEEGSLYPALQRMLRAGWVKARWDTSPSGRRVRVYAITPEGRRGSNARSRTSSACSKASGSSWRR